MRRLALLVVVLLPISARAADVVDYATCVSNGGGPRQCNTYFKTATACENDPFPGSGTIRYVCDCQAPGADANCVAGNDSNAGTSPSAPWQTCTKWKNQASSLAADSTIAICRGGAINCSGVDTRISNHNTSAAHPITIRDYDPTGVWTPVVNVKPILYPGNNGTCFNWGEGSLVHDEGYKLENLDCEVNGATNTAGIFTFEDVTDITICNITANGTPINISGAATFPGGCYTPGLPPTDNCPLTKRLTIKGSQLVNLPNNAFFGFGDSIYLLANYWNTCGADNTLDHVDYFGACEIDATTPMTQVLCQDSKVNDNVIIDAGVTGGVCSGVISIWHGGWYGAEYLRNSISFKNNTANGFCWAVAMSPATANYPDAMYNMTVGENFLQGFGGTGVNFGATINGVIRNNIMITNDNTTPLSGVVINQNFGEKYDFAATNTTITGNTFYAAGNATNALGISAQVSGTGVTAENNLTFFDNSTGGKSYWCLDYSEGEQTLVGGTISTTIGTYTGTTNGCYDITVNGVNKQVTSMDFSAAANIYDVGATMQTRLQALVASAIVKWTGTGFQLTFPHNGSSIATVTKAVAGTAGGGCTDASTLLGLSNGAGATTPATFTAQNFNHCYAQSGPTVTWERQRNLSRASYASTFGFDGNSVAALSTTGVAVFVKPVTSSILSLPFWFQPRFNSTPVSAGTASFGTSTDIYGVTRTSPPDVGAFVRWVPGPQ